MKVLHLISGGETGGSRKHVVTLLSRLPKEEVCLAVFQEGALAQEARESGIRVEVFAQSSRYDLSVLKRLVTFIGVEGFDILHTHGPRANFFGSFIKHKISCKWMTTIHSDPMLDFMKSGIKGKVFTKLNLFSLKRIDYFFAVSERFKENLMKFGISEEKIQAIYNGIEFTAPVEKTNHLYEELNLSEDDFVMTMVARLHPIKGHEMVLNSLKQLNNPSIKLLLVGDGPIRNELEQIADKLDLGKNVRFLGFRKDIQEIYSISSISLLASFSESFPLVLLEAANEQVPIITTDVGGVRELVKPPLHGWVVPVDNQPKYQEAMEEAYQLHVEKTLPLKGQNLRTYAESTYSLQHLAELTRETYKKMII
ncbi:glycosyltransferase [Bacillus sp. AFS015802]|uniref:glycosyltransferase family 4 protein n=1 Tax=Bacillus sp. AFS015802 TaxID=2033486 RepID=UPI000BF52189|nr:glycosyltransferase family 4 protein [Bacillus sp. AFS015802]PFA67328.1 glycosyltransferase [Bacillus sp. AFS015802]